MGRSLEAALTLGLDLDSAAAGQFGVRLDGVARRAGLDGSGRALFDELVRGTLRYRLALDHLLDQQLSRPGKVDRKTRELLRLLAYGLLVADRLPAHALLSCGVDLARRVGRAPMAGLINGVLRGLQRRVAQHRAAPSAESERELPLPDGHVCRFSDAPYAGIADPAERLARRYSYPPWLVARWLDRHPLAAVEGRLAAGNRRPLLVLRVDRRRARREDVIARLRDAGHPARELSGPWAIGLPGGDPARMPLEGDAVVQDLAAMAAVDLAPLVAGQSVLELGAAPGGKTLQLLERCPVRVLAVDSSPRRLQRLSQSLRERGERGVTLLAALGEALPLAPAALFDGVLVDAPCSNTGVMAKRPDLRWRLVPSDLVALASLQAQLLDAAAARLAPGAWLVYGTCGIEPEENEAQVAALLERRPELTQRDSRLDLPEASETGCGGYAAVLARR